jgi:hypothetical protein
MASIATNAEINVVFITKCRRHAESKTSLFGKKWSHLPGKKIDHLLCVKISPLPREKGFTRFMLQLNKYMHYNSKKMMASHHCG